MGVERAAGGQMSKTGAKEDRETSNEERNGVVVQRKGERKKERKRSQGPYRNEGQCLERRCHLQMEGKSCLEC